VLGIHILIHDRGSAIRTPAYRQAYVQRESGVRPAPCASDPLARSMIDVRNETGEAMYIREMGAAVHSGRTGGHAGPRLEFRLLGPVQVWSAGRQLVLRGELQRSLLATLLLRANHVVSTERLIDVLWGEQPPKTARPGLQWQVSRLRRLLAIDPSDADRLAFRAPGYVLRVEPGELDLDRFQSLVDRGQAHLARDEPAAASRLLDRALRLWQDHALENVSTPALAQERARLDARQLAALEDRIEADLKLGRHRELLVELGELVTEFPQREHLRWLQMVALYRAGQPAAAVAAYHRARTVLVDELGVEPGGELSRLLHAILRQESAELA
jgi:DNA-binding SARP family transcriptional activator